jgi:hypothetical protein
MFDTFLSFFQCSSIKSMALHTSKVHAMHNSKWNGHSINKVVAINRNGTKAVRRLIISQKQPELFGWGGDIFMIQLVKFGTLQHGISLNFSGNPGILSSNFISTFLLACLATGTVISVWIAINICLIWASVRTFRRFTTALYADFRKIHS